MDMQKVAGDNSDATLSRLHRQVTSLPGWHGALGGSGDLPWYDAALTRLTLLVGEDEPLWVYGTADASQLVVLTERLLVTCVAPMPEANSTPGEARVWAEALSTVTRVELQGGSSPFGGSIDRWPGSMILTLHLAGGSTNTLPIDDVERSGVLDVWDVLLSGLRG